MEQTNKESQNKIKKFQCKAMQRIMYKKKQDRAEQLQKKPKDLKIP